MRDIVAVKLPRILFADNPAELVFLKNNILVDTGGYASILLCLDEAGAPANTETFKLSFPDFEQLDFVVKDNPTESRLDLPAYTGGDFDDYVKVFAQHLYRHPFIGRYYYVKFISYNSGTGFAFIQIIARERGTAYNLSIEGSTTMGYSSANTETTTIANDDAALTNFKLKGRVTLISDANYNYTVRDVNDVEIYGRPNPDTDCIELTLHELPAIGRTALGVDVPVNAFLPLPHRKAYAYVKVEVAGEYTGADKKSIIQEFKDFGANGVDTNIIVAGGLPLELFPPAATFEDWVKFEVNNQQRFHTFQPRLKLITKQQPEWLSYAIFQQNFTYAVRFTVYYSNGSTTSKLVDINDFSGGIYYIPTGFDQNFLADLHPGGDITEVYYEVIIDFSPYNSETFKYVIDTRHFENSRYFILQNSLGAIDTIRCVGYSEYNIKRKGETSSEALTSDSTAATGSITMVYNELERIYTMRTGWLLTQAEKEYYTELLRSRYVAEVVMPLLQPIGDAYYRQPYRSVIVQADSIKMWSEQDNMWSLEWTMKYAHDETNYSSITPLQQIWYDTFIEFTCQVGEFGASPNIQVGITADAFEVEVNGIVRYWGTPALTITESGTYHFKIRSSGPTGIQIIGNDLTAPVLTINRLEGKDIRELHMFAFDNLKDDYLCRRIETLWSLRQLIFWSYSADPGFNIDRMLAALAINYEAGFNKLTNVDFSFSTPSAAGAEIKDTLIAAGVTVTTL